MNSKLNLVSTREMSREDWLRHRKCGIGASEVGTILGLNQYKSSVELFYEKVSDGLGYDVESIAAFMGREQEDFIADLWQYWDGSQDGMMENYRAGKKLRKCQRVNAYVNNPDYPWLFVSLDRKINKIQNIPNAPGGAVARGFYNLEGALELKTIGGYEAKKWEAGIPPSHIIQVQTQMLVCEFEFGELATLTDGRHFNVYPFSRNEKIQQTIIDRTKDFWERVLKAREIQTQLYEAQRNYNQRAAQEAQAELDRLEPMPDGSEAYEKYLKQRYHLAESGLLQGDSNDYLIALQLADYKGKAKRLEQAMRVNENLLKKRLGSFEVLDFGERGRITWRNSGKGRQFRVALKE